MKTLSVVDSGVAGDTVFVLLPLPRVLRASEPKLFVESRALLELSGFKGDGAPSPKLIPFDGLSVINYQSSYRYYTENIEDVQCTITIRTTGITIRT